MKVFLSFPSASRKPFFFSSRIWECNPTLYLETNLIPCTWQRFNGVCVCAYLTSPLCLHLFYIQLSTWHLYLRWLMGTSLLTWPTQKFLISHITNLIFTMFLWISKGNLTSSKLLNSEKKIWEKILHPQHVILALSATYIWDLFTMLTILHSFWKFLSLNHHSLIRLSRVSSGVCLFPLRSPLKPLLNSR